MSPIALEVQHPLRPRGASVSSRSRRLLFVSSAHNSATRGPSPSKFLRGRPARSFAAMRRPLMERVRSNTRSPLRYLSSLPLRYLAVPLVVWCIVSIVLLSANHLEANGHSHITGVNNKVSPNRMPPPKPLRPLRARIPCYGARGRLLTESPDDELQYSELNVSYPVPFMGSQRELGIDMTWMTADGRYGPYGFGEDRLSYSRSRVDWDAIDWGKLQDECYLQNAHRFPKPLPSVRIGEDKRFSLRSRTNIPLSPSWETFNNTRRTVLVLRSYEGFEYKPENMWSIRSIITEATLRTGGEYAVVMMVNVKNKGLDIFESAEKYEQAFEMLNIPPELRSITILWDERLVQSWYPELKDHSTRWQVNQPLQLFALHHPEFDHYWQIEMDQRYLGDVGKYLDALSEFSRYEPRKQALERTTYPFSEEVYGTYENLTMEVDRRNEGKSRAWGPVVVPEIEPIGPAAPSEHAEDDDFAWGVGEEADVVVTSFCADILETSWEYVGYIEGFQQGIFTPRWWCPPAIMRGSRTVLLTAHKAQLEHGLSIPGEAILPTFALWHSLKISYPPQPVYMHKHDPAVGLDDETSRLESEWRHPNRKPWFGDSPDRSRDGTSRADPRSFADRGLTYWWTSNYPRQVMDIWLNNDIKTPDMPQMLGLENDTIYMPNMVMHPVKTFKEFDKDY